MPESYFRELAFVVTNLETSSRVKMSFYNNQRTAEQWQASRPEGTVIMSLLSVEPTTIPSKL